MRTGDLLEVLAAACFVAATLLSAHWLTFVVAGVCLAYFSQCSAHSPFPWPRLRLSRLPKRKVEK